MKPVTVSLGNSPIVLALPHGGTFVPDDIAQKLNENGLKLADTDWHIDRLYADLLSDVTTVAATFHRYVIDANRDPMGESLYPGRNTTTLVPLTDFDGLSIWDTPPTQAEIDQRRTAYHTLYHSTLAEELARVRDRHGFAILYDCHSIRSEIPFLFNGTLPDFNIGTNLSTTCAIEVEISVLDICTGALDYTSAINARFKGGWTTRHYGQPRSGIHAIQMELSQSTYLSEEAAPWVYDQDKATRLRPHLSFILTTLANLKLSLGDPR